MTLPMRFLRRTMKALHELGSIGYMGSLAACLVMIVRLPTHSLTEYATARRAIATVAEGLLVPSLAAVLVSGLLAIAVNKNYMNAGWAWFKALLGVTMFEGTLLSVVSSAKRASELAAMAAAGQSDPVQLAEVLHTERGGLWLMLALSFVNIVLAVWRPKFTRLPD
jgi:hypothetical protein